MARSDNNSRAITGLLNQDKRYLIIPLLIIPLWFILYLNLRDITDFIIYNILSMNSGTHLTAAVWFFIYEVPKVFLLLILIVFGVGIIRSYFSPEKTRRILGGKRLFAGNVSAALLGVVTPFCSCSAIPLFLGFIKSGVPLGVTFSFLISAPMVNEVALVLLFGLFGWKTALLYMSTGLTIAIFAGFSIGKLKLEKYVEDWVYEMKAGGEYLPEEKLTFRERVETGLAAVKDIVGKVWIYIVLGIGVGAGIHGYVPENFMAGIMGKSAWWSVPAAVLLGVPMYSNAAGIIPVVQALLGKGASLGTVLAFMMSVIALSLPEIIILKKVLKTRLIITFVGIVAAGIILVGWIFNLVY
ncbi:MAG: permease [Ignavibacteriaceae bacterium]|nr:permease [Ignavibacteriaceae bacterium]NUM72598.1 permease [Ignavibacteriaceae bacterium]